MTTQKKQRREKPWRYVKEASKNLEFGNWSRRIYSEKEVNAGVVCHIDTLPEKADENAAFIVKCCNNYEALIEVLKEGIENEIPMSVWIKHVKAALKLAGEV